MIDLKHLTLIAALAAGAPALAQEASEGTDAEGSDLTLGTPVNEGPQVGQAYIREESGDWALRCLKATEGQPDPCQLYQLLLDDEGNAVAEISMFPLPDGGQAAAGATIVAPLETLLTQNLQIAVDGGSARAYPFTFCNAAGCVARLGFTQAEVDQFKRGREATLRIVPAGAPDEEVILTISLTGFTAALDLTTTPAE